MSQSVDPFAYEDVDLEIDMGNLISLSGGPYPEQGYSDAQSYPFMNGLEPVVGASIADEDFSMFFDSTQTEEQTVNQDTTIPQQSYPLETSVPPTQAQSPGKKRKLEDCLSQFEGVKNLGRKRRQRRTFAPERRKEVDQVRKVGACLRCRITKSRVSTQSWGIG